MDADTKARFDEIRSDIALISTDLRETRHTLNGSSELQARLLAESVVKISNHGDRFARIELLISEYSKEHDARLRAMEKIAASMQDVPRTVGEHADRLRNVELTAAAMGDVPDRVNTLETRTHTVALQLSKVGRFSWGDVFRVVTALAAFSTIFAGIVAAILAVKPT